MRRLDNIISIYIYILIICGWKIVNTKKDEGEDTHNNFKVITVNGSDYNVNDTSKYYIEEQDYITNYKFKNEGKCVEIRYGDSPIWKNSNKNFNIFPRGITLNFFSKTMLVEYTNNWLYIYKHKNIYELNSKIGANVVDPSEINIVTYDAFGYKVNDETQYLKRCIGYVLGYNFKQHSRCVELRYNHNIIWKHNTEECGTEYPKSMFINLYSKIIMINLADDWSYFSKNRSDPNSSKESDELNQNEDILSNIKLLTKGLDNRLRENDKNSYDIIVYKNVYEFRLKDNVCCTEVKYKNNVIWKFNENELKNNFPKAIYFNTYAKMILLDLNNNWRYFYKYKQDQTDYDNQFTYTSVSEESGKSEENKTADQAIQNYFSYYVNGKETKLISLDIASKASTNDYDYFVDVETNTSVYIPKEGCLFSVVKQKGSWNLQSPLELWSSKYDNVNNVVYSNRVVIYGSNKKEFNVEIYLINGTRANFDVEFYHSPKNKSRLETLNNLPISEQPKNITVSIENSDIGYIVDMNKLHDNKLDIKEMTSYDYRFRQNSKCIEFKIDDQSVWIKDTSENRFPKSIYYHKDLKLVFVEFNLQTFNIYKYLNNEWKLVYNNKMKVVILDINTKKTANEFEYSKSSKVGTYEAKNDYKIKTVKSNDNIIWETNDPSEFAIKVSMDPVAPLESIKYVNIFLCNGSTREYRKDGKKWIQNYEQEDLSNSYESLGSQSIEQMGGKQDQFNPNEYQELSVSSTIKQERSFDSNFLKNLRIITADDLEGTNPKENDTEKYKIELNAHSHYIIFADNSNCIEILYGNETVWKYDFNSKNTPKNLYVDLNSKMIVINLGDQNSISYKYNDIFDSGQQNNFNPPINPSYKPQDNSTILASLDLKSVEGTNEFHYFVDYESNTGIYIPKEGYLFSKVFRGGSGQSDNLWESDHYPYCNRALINPIDKDMFNLELSLINGTKINIDKNSIYPTINSDSGSKQYLLQSEYPNEVIVVTIDDSDPNNPVENDISKFVVNKSIFKDSQGLNKVSYDYRFRQNSKCIEFKIDDQSVWIKDTSENRFPKSIYYHKDLKLVFVEFNLQTFNIYKYLNNEWKLVYNT
ncbi:SfiI-subtelomeric fragment related protein family member, putative [Theileria annulata]|uniref:SfiI-subtelomeric related protein family member, putative n=1 Tax=Theileria annulata TaxID=5874 RepID=Q4UAR2_THEAN|nr:SfiI-subtelomeric fragment related protein family member, putative [Theileria annulata]CAI76089.1 SfiI-subtelomeric fragment related protein family member, putative [Theileria annulata]